MSADSNNPKMPSAAGVGCLASVLGAVVGFFAVYIWSNSQVHTMRSGYVLRGEHRAMMVIGDAFLGAIAGGVVVSVIALIWRRFRKEAPELRKPAASE